VNWLITGGTGFIGSRLVNHLYKSNKGAIRIIDNLSVGSRKNLAETGSYREVTAENLVGPPDGVELVVGDIRDADLALRATQGIEAIVHLAGNTGVQPSIEDPLLDCSANVLGTLNYLEAAREHGITKFVFASSGGTVIGDVTPPINEDMVPKPKSPYGASKSACEGYLCAYHGTFGIETIALRFGNVYGPGSDHKGSVVAKFIRQGLASEPLEIYGDGSQTRDFVYIDDLIGAIVKAAYTPNIGGEVFQIASNRETTISEIAKLISSLLSQAGVQGVQVQHTNPLAGEIRRNFSDTSKAKQLLNWQASIGLTEGLKETITWYLQTQTRTDDPV